MSLILLASVKGSPGVTTGCLALATTWPRTATIVELDPDGGDIRYRLRDAAGKPLTAEPGLLSYATGGATELKDHVQALAGGIDLLVGLPGAFEAPALTGRWSTIAERLDAHLEADVLADCGRLSAFSPVVEAFPHATGLVIFTRPTVDAVGHLRSRLDGLDGLPPVFVIVVTGVADRRSSKQVQAILTGAQLSTNVLGALAYDPEGAGMLAGEWPGRLAASPLIRSARDLAGRLAREVSRRAGSVPAR